MSSPCLPVEVWTLVLRLLPLSDRLRVRASCKYFRDLVDDSSVWRDWTVRLKRSGDEYEEGFWSMLRRWRVTSAHLTSPHGWTRVAKELPGLTTLTIHIEKFTHTQDLKSLTNLKHLTLYPTVNEEDFTPFLPQQLTYLKMCQPGNQTYTLPAQFPPDSPFKTLKSLVFHSLYNLHPVNVLHFFLSSLPQLEHLSLHMYTDTSFEGHISDLTPLQDCSLSSLELVECDSEKLPVDLMKMLGTLPFLRSLAIFCCDDEEFDDKSEKLSSWLSDLPALTSLLVHSSNVRGFVGSIPSVTRLILMGTLDDSFSEDMAALSARLPNLHHLHLHLHNLLRSDTALIPRFFPRVKTLRLFHKEVPEDVFLSLGSLKELEVLETLDMDPLPAALVSKLRELTNNRVRIYNSPDDPWNSLCLCLYGLPTHYWVG